MQQSQVLNLRGFFNHFCTLLSDEQRPLFRYDEQQMPSIVLMQGVVVLAVQPGTTGYDASLQALQCREPKVYHYGAFLMSAFVDHFLAVTANDIRDAIDIAVYGSAYQVLIPLSSQFEVEAMHAHGTVLRKDQEKELTHICGAIVRRKK